jgi:hypothetical protein
VLYQQQKLCSIRYDRMIIVNADLGGIKERAVVVVS